MNADTHVVLIHGLWMTPRSWEGWGARYEDRGYRVLAPAWPGLEVEVEELRRDPSPLTRLDVPKVVDHYDGIIRGLESPPIVMGHCSAARSRSSCWTAAWERRASAWPPRR